MDVPGDGQFSLDPLCFDSARWLLERAEDAYRTSAARLREADEACRASASRVRKAESIHGNSARRLREVGKDDRARRAEQRAAWVRSDLAGPQAAERLYAAVKGLRGVVPLEELLDKALAEALSLIGADRGNIQILDPETGALTIRAQRGFDTEFLDYFATVNDDRSACGRALTQCAQVVIADVNTDPGFAGHREIAAASGFRAVQSTPLLDGQGLLVGVVSTHYPKPYIPPQRDLGLIGRFGQVAGRAINGHLGASRIGAAAGNVPAGRSR